MNKDEVIEHYFYGKGQITDIRDQKIYVNFPDYGQRIFKNNERAESYLSSNNREVILDEATQPPYQTICEALNAALGKNYKRIFKSYWVISSSFALWFPKLVKIKNGKQYPATNNFMNILSDDCNVIEEIAVNEQREEPINMSNEPTYRLVFTWDTNNTQTYIFHGVYTIVPEKSTKRRTIHKRVSTRGKLTGSPANSLEILN